MKPQRFADRLDRLAGRSERTLASAFIEAVRLASGAINATAWVNAVRESNATAAAATLDNSLDVMERAIEGRFRRRVEKLTDDAFRLTERHIASLRQLSGTELTQVARMLTGQLQGALRSTASKSIAEFTQRVIVEGWPPERAARYLKLSITSLDPLHEGAIAKFRQGLIDQGVSLEDIDRRVARQIEARIRQRARMIAETEANRTANRAVIEAGMRHGVERKRWYTRVDETVCPICEPLHGETVPLGELFSSGDEQPPAHPRCRCAITLVKGSPRA